MAELIAILKDFSAWIGLGCASLVVWFVIRFITQRDKFEENQGKFRTDMTADLTKFKDDIEKKLTEHAKNVKESADKVSSAVKEVKDEAMGMKKASFDFQSKIMDDLLSIKKETVEIEGMLIRTNDKSEVLESKFDEVAVKVKELYSHVEKIQETVDKHQKSLGLGAQAMKIQRDEIVNMKTEVKKLNDNLIILKTKRDGGTQ